MPLHVTDVGDGLCLTIGSHRRSRVQVDCGSQQGARFSALQWIQGSAGVPLRHSIKALILSHYHTDHYNGLVWAANAQSHFPRLSRVSHIYSPGLPDPPISVPLLRANLAFAAFTLGTRSGVMEVDFRRVAQRLVGNRPLTHRRLYAGDRVYAGGGLFLSVHWPPRVLPVHAREPIQSAVRRFEKAIEESGRRALKDLYDQARSGARTSSVAGSGRRNVRTRR